jgi:hypothetical protein
MSEELGAGGGTDGSSRRVVYLVLSHDRPEQVQALATRILALSPEGQVVIHHDARAPSEPWDGHPPARVHRVDRLEVTWGDWSIVEASLRLLRYATRHLDAQWFVFLSGADRPIVDLAGWEQTVLTPGVDGIVSARPITRRAAFGHRPTGDDLNFARYTYRWRPLRSTGREGLDRVLAATTKASRYLQPLFAIERAGRRGGWFIGVPRRRPFPHGWTLYTGPQWLAFDRTAANVVLGADDAVVDWFRRTWIPDQAFFHTILYNHPELRLRNERLTFVVPQRYAAQRPEWMVLRAGDLDDVMGSGAAFARKFDPAVDATVADLIDSAVDDRRAASAPPPAPSADRGV